MADAGVKGEMKVKLASQIFDRGRWGNVMAGNSNTCDGAGLGFDVVCQFGSSQFWDCLAR